MSKETVIPHIRLLRDLDARVDKLDQIVGQRKELAAKLLDIDSPKAGRVRKKVIGSIGRIQEARGETMQKLFRTIGLIGAEKVRDIMEAGKTLGMGMLETNDLYNKADLRFAKNLENKTNF